MQPDPQTAMAKINAYLADKLPPTPLDDNISLDVVGAAGIPEAAAYFHAINIPGILLHLRFIVFFCLTSENFRAEDMAKNVDERIVKKSSHTCLQYLYNYFYQQGHSFLLSQRLRNMLRLKKGIIMLEGQFRRVHHEHLGILILGILAYKYPDIVKKDCKQMSDVPGMFKKYCLCEADWKKFVLRSLKKTFDRVEAPPAKIRVRIRCIAWDFQHNYFKKNDNM